MFLAWGYLSDTLTPSLQECASPHAAQFQSLSLRAYSTWMPCGVLLSREMSERWSENLRSFFLVFLPYCVVGVGGMQPDGFVQLTPLAECRDVMTRRLKHPALSQYLRPNPGCRPCPGSVKFWNMTAEHGN